MNELIDFFTSKEIIVVYIVAAVACILCFIIYLIDKNYYKRKQRQNTRELNKLVEEVNEIVENEAVSNEIYNTPILSPIVEENMTLEDMKDPILIIDEQLENFEVQQPIITEKVVENVEIIEQSESEKETLAYEQVIEELSVVEENIEEELQYTNIEPDRKQAQEELMRLTEELEKAEQEARTINLTSYEEEQEENAIISLEELVRKSKEMYESNEIMQYEDEGNEPISLEDLERRMKNIKEEIISLEETKNDTKLVTITEAPIIDEVKPQQLVLDDFNTIKVDEILENVAETKLEPVKPLYQSYQTEKKFERSPIISPIYGIERKDTVENISLENTANYDKLDEEIKKTNEFLMTLRELQKNLD